jgi:hypothetical protein
MPSDEGSLLSVSRAAVVLEQQSASELLSTLSFQSSNVTQMALLVENVAQSIFKGDAVDADLKHALELIRNETLSKIEKSLMNEHDLDQVLADGLNQCYHKCTDQFAEELQDVERAKGKMQTSLTGLRTCRSKTLESYANMITTCHALDVWIAGLDWPKACEEECVWNDATIMGGCFRGGITWYEKTYEEWERMHKACLAAVELYHEEDKQCDSQQMYFEVDTCTLRQEEWTSCQDHLMTCCGKCSVEFDETVSQIECREKDRKVDYSAVQKIECYLDIIELSLPDEELKEYCDANGENCHANMRIQKYKECEKRCENVDYDGHEYFVVDGVNGTHRLLNADEEKRCTRSLDVNFPRKVACPQCPPIPEYPCQSTFVHKYYGGYMENGEVPGIALGTPECPGQIHETYFGYSQQECRPCPELIGLNPAETNARCQAFGNEVRVMLDDHVINLMEVKVNKMTAADGVTAHLDTTHTSYVAGNCIDGDESTMCHSVNGKGTLTIILPAADCVQEIEIVNRGDCCKDRIVGAKVEVLYNGVVQWGAGLHTQQDRYSWSLKGDGNLPAIVEPSDPVPEEPVPPHTYDDVVTDVVEDSFLDAIVGVVEDVVETVVDTVEDIAKAVTSWFGGWFR